MTSRTFDTASKRVRAPLVAGGRPAGVDLEIRYGGPAIGFQQVSAQLYADPEITLGLVSTDEAIQNSARLATLAVLAPLELSPAMLMWDKTRHPDVHTIADLGRTGVPVLYYQTDTYMQYLLGAGLLRPEQVDGSYDGGPSRWVAADGDVAQAGFATAEPYIYRSELGPERSYDVDLQLINDTGYPGYFLALSIKAADRERLAPCLRKLVPMVQRAQVDFMRRPGPDQRADRAGRAGRRELGVELLPRPRRLRGAHHARARHRRQRPHPDARRPRPAAGGADDRDTDADLRRAERPGPAGPDARAPGDQRVPRPGHHAAPDLTYTWPSSSARWGAVADPTRVTEIAAARLRGRGQGSWRVRRVGADHGSGAPVGEVVLQDSLATRSSAEHGFCHHAVSSRSLGAGSRPVISVS